MRSKLIVASLATCVTALGQFSGPSILSRGNESGFGERGGRQVGFRFYAGVNAIMDTGLTPVSVDAAGNLVEVDHVYGTEASIGAYGHKRWKRTELGLDYTGNYRYYTTASYYNGSDQLLGLTYATQLAKRAQVSFRSAAGTMDRTFAGDTTLLATSEFIGVPNNGIFDNRAYFLQTIGDVAYQKSARLGFSAGGDGFFVRRQSKSLVGVNGYGAHGRLSYRINRSTSIGASYNFNHFDYQRAFGESDSQTVGIGVTHLLNRRWKLNVEVGASKVDTIGITSVAADPVTAALFGQSTVIEAFSARRYYPAGRVEVTGSFRRSSVNLAFSEQPSPGNGIYLTSQSRNGTASYSYNTLRNASFSVSFTYSDLESVGQANLGRFAYISGGASATYRITRVLHATARYDARQGQIVDTVSGFSRIGSRVSIGLTFSPGEMPLSFW